MSIKIYYYHLPPSFLVISFRHPPPTLNSYFRVPTSALRFLSLSLSLSLSAWKGMSPTKEVRYTSRSITPPPKRQSRSISPQRSRARSRSRSQDSVDVSNPGNNLYITGLSPRVTSSDLEKYFNREGKVLECQVVTDPRTKESRGFAFVTMETVEDAQRCVKYLNCSVLEGRLITVEKAKRGRGRTPTPGKYCGSRERRDRGRKRSRSHSPYRSRQRDHSHSRSRRQRSRSPYSRDSHRRRREHLTSAASGDNH